MAWFKKKDRVIDLAEHYRKQQEKAAEIQEDISSPTPSVPVSQEAPSNGMFGIFGGATPTPDTSSDNSGIVDFSATTSSSESSVNPAERKRKLAKRLMEMTEKMEDLNNQIYRLQQRVEVLERKTGTSGY